MLWLEYLGADGPGAVGQIIGVNENILVAVIQGHQSATVTGFEINF